MTAPADIDVTTISVGLGLCKDAITCCLVCYKLVRKWLARTQCVSSPEYRKCNVELATACFSLFAFIIPRSLYSTKDFLMMDHHGSKHVEEVL